MTNDDLKRFYNVNEKPEQNKDFVRYGSNGEIISEHDATKDEEVVNYRTLMQHASGGSGLTEVTASDVNSEQATSGQILTADGNGGASWQNASGGSSGDKLYRHEIVVTSPGYFTLQMTLPINTLLTNYQLLTNAINSYGGVNANGYIYVNGKTYSVIGLERSSDFAIVKYLKNTDGVLSSTFTSSTNITTIYDIVYEL